MEYAEWPFWKHYEFTEEEMLNVWLFLDKPPPTFKLLGSFEDNAALIAEKIGLPMHPEYLKQPYIPKPFLEVSQSPQV